MSRGAERVLLLGLGALLVHLVVLTSDVLIRHVNPITQQPTRKGP